MPEFDGMADAVYVAEGRMLVLLHHITGLHLLVPKHLFPGIEKFRAGKELRMKG
jgi:hypothetical protein